MDVLGQSNSWALNANGTIPFGKVSRSIFTIADFPDPGAPSTTTTRPDSMAPAISSMRSPRGKRIPGAGSVEIVPRTRAVCSCSFEIASLFAPQSVWTE